MADISLGQAAYEGYMKAYLPDSRRGWLDLSARQRAAWETAATAVLEACGG